MLFKLAAPVLIGGSILLAADVWQTKQPSEWNDKDVQKLMTKSPWAKEVTVSLGPPGGGFAGGSPSGFGQGEGEIGASAMGGGGGRGGGRGGRGGGGEMGSFGPSMRVYVRFHSAAPVQAAMNRGAEPKPDDEVAQLARDHYVIAIEGLRTAGGRRVPGETQQPDNAVLAQFAAAMKDVSALTIKGKAPIAAARIAAMRGTRAPVWLFCFPRKDAITLNDKEVAFTTKTPTGLDIKAKFTLKDMLYQGKLEL